jgi:protein-disulfide isomerase
MVSRKWSLLLPVLLLGTLAGAQTVKVHPALRPPPGAQVAIVVFEDLQCPDCRRASPLLEEAARTYKIPLVRHDFPIPRHNWSFEAAVMARFFDTKSQELGNEFRDYIFRNQPQIQPNTLRRYAEEFAAEHKVDLPFAIDPRGELEKKVRADYALGQAIGIQHTPTIYVVNNATTGTPFVEVVNRDNLFALIDKMKREAAPVATAATKRTKRRTTPE